MKYENFWQKKFHFSIFFCNFVPFLVKIMINKDLFFEKLYAWYEQNHRVLPWRETDDPYRIWISEIILQQTRVAQGLEYYERFIARFPNVATLADAQEDEVLLYWQGLGYYSRARNLYKAACQMNGVFPTTWEGLRLLPGIGDYTAGAIASFAYNLPYPALDGNVYRVLARLFDSEVVFDTSAGKHHFHDLAEDLLDRNNPRLFNSAIMEFGALYCTPQSPDCSACPLSAFCLAAAHGTVALLPVRKARPVLRDRYLNYSIYITPSGQTLIHQRCSQDIWQHLYEFPLQEADKLLPQEDAVQILDFTHVLSHQRLHARFFLYPVETLPHIPDTIAVNLHDMDQYAFSRLTLRAIEKIWGISL